MKYNSFKNIPIAINKQPKHLAVKLTSKGEKSVIQGHPWVFSNSIVKVSADAASGDLVIIFSKTKNKMIGIGLYDASSPIRIKLIHPSSQKVVIDSAFFQYKIDEAFRKRKKLLQTNTNAYRLIFGENDGFPGLIADVYANVLVVKLYSEIWLPYLELVLHSLQSVTKSATVVIRLSRKLQQSKQHNLTDGAIVIGILKYEIVEFKEHGVNFLANVVKGHKTGYFLDHRHNRKQVGEWSSGQTVLDVFSYAGGFSVHALANGAAEVTSIDISKQALDIARENANLNDFSGIHKTLSGDAFELLQQLIQQGKRYGVVVIDPPSFAKQQSEIQLAKKKYAQLATLGTLLTAKNGLLVLASCSSRVTAQAFFDINNQTIVKNGRIFKMIKKTEHDIDHPITFPEGAYLKCGYYRFAD